MPNNTGLSYNYEPYTSAGTENPYMLSKLEHALNNLYELPEMKIVIDEINRRYEDTIFSGVQIIIKPISYTGGAVFRSGPSPIDEIWVDSNQLTKMYYSYISANQSIVQERVSLEEILAHELLHALQASENRNYGDSHEEIVVNTIDLLRVKYWGKEPRGFYQNRGEMENVSIDFQNQQDVESNVVTFSDPVNGTNADYSYENISWDFVVYSSDAQTAANGVGAIGKLVGLEAGDTLPQWVDDYSSYLMGGAFVSSDLNQAIKNALIANLSPDAVPEHLQELITQWGNSRNTRDPLVFDLDGDGFTSTTINDGVYFDLDANGFANATAWIEAEDGFLVRDLNEDGVSQ